MTDPRTADVASSEHHKYGNFRDPAGLVLRMLKSGNRAAYGALLRAGMSIGTVPFDRLLERWERGRIAAANPAVCPQPLVLVVGPPRSGSTLLYQTLARFTDVSYVSNLTALFPRSPITATRLSPGRGLHGGADFQSYYGQTAGLAAPNDGFEVWNRWLGGNRYQTCDALDDAVADDMRRFFAAWTAEFGRPFLNKNNRNTDCMRLLADVLPRASFVVIRRDPLFVAQSLIESRAGVQGAKDRSWGLASTEEHAAGADEPLGYVDDVCDQLITIETRLQEQAVDVDPQRVIEVTYEDFCRQPRETVERIVRHVPGLRLRDETDWPHLQPFTISACMRLTNAEQQRIEQRIAESPLLSSTHSTEKTNEQHPPLPLRERDRFKAVGFEAG